MAAGAAALRQPQQPKEMDLSLPRGAIKTSHPSCIPSQQLSRVHLSKGRCRSLLRDPTKGRFARHDVAPEICSLSVLVLQGSGWSEIRGIFPFLQPGGFLIRVLVRRPSNDSCVLGSASPSAAAKVRPWERLNTKLPPLHRQLRVVASALQELSSQTTKCLRAGSNPSFQVKSICSNQKKSFFFFLRKKSNAIFKDHSLHLLLSLPTFRGVLT